MTGIHATLAWIAAGLSAVALLAYLATILRGDPRLRAVADALLLIALLAIVVNVAAGALTLVTGGGLGDPLHVVYALALPLVLAGGRFFLNRRTQRQQLAALGVWALVTAGVALRLFLTGTGT